VQDFLVRQARADLTAASTRHAAAVGREISRITIRDVRSRWGSCSASGRLSFSWRIVMAPPWVIDYLAAHEVAHLVHLDHSHRFWSLVAELCPGYAAARQWLRRHGAELHRYGK
jgi:predicted metal-dependent hydrolase